MVVIGIGEDARRCADVSAHPGAEKDGHTLRVPGARGDVQRREPVTVTEPLRDSRQPSEKGRNVSDDAGA